MNASQPICHPLHDTADILYFQNLLHTYKKAYFLSYDFILYFNEIYVDSVFTVPLYVKPITGPKYWPVILTVPFTAPYQSDLALAFTYLFNQYPYCKPSLLLDSRALDPRESPSPVYRDFYGTIYNTI